MTGDRVRAVRLPIPPSLNRTYRIGKLGAKGRGVMFKTGEAKLYAFQVGNICRKGGAYPLEGPVSVSLVIYRPRKAGDLDNYLKVLLDALQGALYRKDSQIRKLVAELDDQEPQDPRVIVVVEEMP